MAITPVIEHTFMCKSISTLPAQGRAQNLPDFEGIRKGMYDMDKRVNNRRVIKAGVLYNNNQSPSEGGTLYTAKEICSNYQMCGSDFPGGGRDGAPDDEDGYGNCDRSNRDGFYK